MSVAAVLYAAGRGHRLRPLTDDVAKPAVPMLDVPLAAFGLRRLYEAAPAVVLNVRHLPRSVTAAVARYVPPGRRLDTLFETPEAYGTAGTLVALREGFPRPTRRVLTWNSDLLTDLSALDLLATHSAGGAPATIAVAEVEAGADFVTDGGRAVAFVDRRKSAGVPGAVFIGAAVFERHVLDRLPETRPLGLGETLLAWLADAGELAVHRHAGYWRDVGSPASYLVASLDLVAGRGPGPPDGTWPGEIVSGAYLGPGVSGEPGPGGVLLARSRVEPGATVERAVVWPGSVVPAGTELRDAIWFGGRALPAQS